MAKEEALKVIAIVVCWALALALAFAIHDFVMRSYDAHLELRKMMKQQYQSKTLPGLSPETA